MTQLSSAEKEYYDRHLILDNVGLTGQEQLKSSKVLVIGAGGLGCPVLQYLAAAGVGTIGILDGDVVSVSNLHRQILYTIKDVGKSKAETAAKRLRELNPYITINIENEYLTTYNALRLFEQYDIIIDGTDNFQTRYLANDAAVITNKPLVFGSIFKFEGQVSVFNYKNGPTYRCLYPHPPKPHAVPNCSQIGVLGVLPGVIGTYMANEVLKIILGLNGILSGKLMLFNAESIGTQILNITKSEASQVEVLLENYDVFCGINPVTDLESMSIEDINSLNESVFYLDVKTEAEHLTEVIPSVNIPLQKLSQDYKSLPNNRTIVVFCKSGIRSQQAILTLKELGLTNRLIQLKQ